MTPPDAAAAPPRSLAERLLGRIRRETDYHVVRADRFGDHLQAEYLRRLLPLLEIDCVLDVGGNAGQFRDLLRGPAGYRGHVVTYEPIPAMADALRRRAAGDAAWEIAAVAVGETVGNATLHVTTSSPLSSLLPPSARETERLAAFNVVADQVTVPVVRLDDEVRRLQATRGFRRFYLKLDTQGFELACLRGATAVLESVPALQAELGVVPLYEGAPDFVTVVEFLREAGYLMSFIPPQNPEHFPSMIDFDAHFTRRDALAALGTVASA